MKVKGLRLKVRKRERRGGVGAEVRSAALSTPAQGRWMGREGAEVRGAAGSMERTAGTAGTARRTGTDGGRLKV